MAEVRLACALRFLAGGQVLDLRETSELGIRVSRGDLPEGFFIIGDSAFNLGPGMMVPTNQVETTDFDFEQCSNRMPIEYVLRLVLLLALALPLFSCAFFASRARCSFGMLVRRWGILWRPLEMNHKRRAAVIGACMRLHNYCIDKRLLCDLNVSSSPFLFF